MNEEPKTIYSTLTLLKVEAVAGKESLQLSRAMMWGSIDKQMRLLVESTLTTRA
jgi:hypothetical protein